MANAIIGGWQVSGLYRQTSGLPTSFYASCVWPTNWNCSSNAVLSVMQDGGIYKNAVAPPGGASGPTVFQDPGRSLRYFDYALPGESGDRSIIRGDGLFNIDLGQTLQIRAEAFNLTNSRVMQFGVRYGFQAQARQTQPSGGAASSALFTFRVCHAMGCGAGTPAKSGSRNGRYVTMEG